MTQTILKLPAKVLGRARRIARAEGLPLEKILRTAVEVGLKRNGKKNLPSFFEDDFCGTDDLPPDVAENPDKYLNMFMDEEIKRWGETNSSSTPAPSSADIANRRPPHDQRPRLEANRKRKNGMRDDKSDFGRGSSIFAPQLRQRDRRREI